MSRSLGNGSLICACDFMSIHAKKYAPLGRCLYCGDTSGPLSDEHIIPFAMGGTWVLPKSSCATCAKVTQKIEEVCTHERWGMFYQFRASHGFPSRKGWSKRKTTRQLIQIDDGKTELTEFPGDSMPSALFGMRLPLAGILSGDPPTNGHIANVVMRIGSPKVYDPNVGKVPTQVATFYPTAFMQLLAKIGLALATAEMPEEKLLPMLSDIVLGRCDTPTYLIGGWQDETDIPSHTNYMQLRQYSTAEMTAKFVVVQLFGKYGMPKYHVVVSHSLSDQILASKQ